MEEILDVKLSDSVFEQNWMIFVGRMNDNWLFGEAKANKGLKRYLLTVPCDGLRRFCYQNFEN